jgi:hypothetical protein
MEKIERAFVPSRLSGELMAAAYEKLVPIPRARLPARSPGIAVGPTEAGHVQVRRRAS